MVRQLTGEVLAARPGGAWNSPAHRYGGPALAVLLFIALAYWQPRVYPELPVSVLYLIPIAILGWTAGRNVGLAGAAAAVVLRLAIDLLVPHSMSHWSVPYLNLVISLPLYILAIELLQRVRGLVERERSMAMTDQLTRLGNRRFFLDLARFELNRTLRYRRPLALGYVDVDYFKEVNDRLGHAAGDQLLCLIAKELGVCLRTSDVVARLGGDEFAVLLPETPPEGAVIAFGKMHEHLTNAVKAANYPVTFSVGVVTYDKGPVTLDELLDEADGMMYGVKHSGKGAVASRSHGTPVAPPPAAPPPDGNFRPVLRVL